MPGMSQTLKKSPDLGKLPILIGSPYKQKKIKNTKGFRDKVTSELSLQEQVRRVGSVECAEDLGRDEKGRQEEACAKKLVCLEKSEIFIVTKEQNAHGQVVGASS